MLRVSRWTVAVAADCAVIALENGAHKAEIFTRKNIGHIQLPKQELHDILSSGININAKSRITGILAEQGISIDAVLQREADEVAGEGATQTDLIILTHDTREGTLNDVLAQMQSLPTVMAPIVRIRKEELN